MLYASRKGVSAVENGNGCVASEQMKNDGNCGQGWQRDRCHLATDGGLIGPGAPFSVPGSFLRMLSNGVKHIGLQMKLIMSTYKGPIGLG